MTATTAEVELGGATAAAKKRWIYDWRPEDLAFWESQGKRIALRNLVLSAFAEHVGFAIWSIWSVMVLFMSPAYGISPAQKFLLTTLPTLLGAAARIPYTLAIARFGARNWTVVSVLLLLIPAATLMAVMKPGTSYGVLLLAASTAGFGGGNFASSMTNINAFYPERRKGWALGVNAGAGNLGVAAVQLVGLAVLLNAGATHPRYVMAVYLPLVALAAVLAWARMDNLASVRNDTKAMRELVTDRHAWIVSLLYIGSFGSFIGFSFAFGQVLLVTFAYTPTHAAELTFIGPLVGSLIRPFGGWLADRFGGAKVTLSMFLALAGAAAVVLAASHDHSLGLFLLGFIALFGFAGIGNGSIFKMIPAIYRATATGASADLDARRLAGALIGIAGAIGAAGGAGVNLAFRQSFLANQNANAAYATFIAFYLLCAAVTFAAYLRPGIEWRRSAHL
ncbi:MAG TPA: MFS transporter [Mycobacteriales bacterium]|nr:MFS transporter [Mycobacteriales bacterium]